MTKATSAQGTIIFQCRCQLSVEGNPEDTLMASGQLETTADTSSIHSAFVEAAAYDPAGNIVKKDCPNCGLDFMTMIRIGIAQTTIYVCSCKYQTA